VDYVVPQVSSHLIAYSSFRTGPLLDSGTHPTQRTAALVNPIMMAQCT